MANNKLNICTSIVIITLSDKSTFNLKTNSTD